MKKLNQVRCNRRWAHKLWEGISPMGFVTLAKISEDYHFSIPMGDLIYLEGKWYVTHIGLLRLAQRKSCTGILVELVRDFSNPAGSCWIFRATVYKNQNCNGFVGYGDADPSNVSPLVHGAEMRVAETRAVNRALRKAYGIGICSVEEIGSFAGPIEPTNELKKIPPQSAPANGKSSGTPRVRDHLCQIIRQHQLDPVLVKGYAVDFCGTKTLRDAHPRAGRELRRPPGGLGGKGPQCPALPTQ
jgi:hypothetical protein